MSTLPGLLWLLILAAIAGALRPVTTHADTPPVTVFAAASLTDVLTETGRVFRERHGVVIRHSFASSGQVARQLESGAAVEMIITADREWMDYLEQRRLVQRESVGSLARNRLVVIAPAASTVRLDPTRASDWSRALGRGRWVSADPSSVPLGRYARQALEKLGVWSVLDPRLARAENARAALALVARGEAALGVVYLTDARSERRVRIVANLPQDSHATIEYPAALTPRATLAAERYLEFLVGPQGQEIFARYGY
jgi:molybdate transport system substrate-binding protein